MKCVKCGAELDDGVLFCRECGAKVINNEVRFCRNCGKEIKAGSQFCSYCGAPLALDFLVKADSGDADESTLDNDNSELKANLEQKSLKASNTGTILFDSRGNVQTYSNDGKETIRDSASDTEETDSSNEGEYFGEVNKNSFSSKEANGLKEFMKGFWHKLDLFEKVSVCIGVVVLILLLVGVLSHKRLVQFISVFQIALLVVAWLMHKGKIAAQYNWAKYVAMGLVVLLSIFAVKVPSKPKNEPEDNEISFENQEPTNYVIENGSEYAFMSGEADVYIAKAVSESIITIEHWDKSILTSKALKYVKEIGSYKINDPENGFSWIDDEHTAFRFTFQDSSTSAVKSKASHIFTIDIYEDDEYKGTNLCDKVPGYSYTNDDWHMYFAIPLTDRFIKIERWSRPNSLAGFCFAGDWCIIDTDNSDNDFEWTDDEKTSFTITTQDPGNSSYWKENKFVVFKLENPGYIYSSIHEYLENKYPELDDDETTVPKSSSSFKYDDYKDVEQILRDAGFTNISTEIQYDIVWGWTSEGEVEKVTIDGKTSYEKGDIFKKDVPIVIFYHMKEEDDPNKQTVENTEPAQPAESSQSTEPVQPSETESEPDPVPAETSEPQEETNPKPKKMSKDEFVKKTEDSLADLEVSNGTIKRYNVWYRLGVFYIDIYAEGIAESAAATINYPSELRPKWNAMLEELRALSKRIKVDAYREGFDSYDVVIQLIDPKDTNVCIAKFKNGTIEADAVSFALD